MKFVSIKNIEQQDILLLHRARELLVKQKTAQSNQIRGLLAEYGVVIPKGLTPIKKLPLILDNNAHKLTVRSQEIFMRLYEQFNVIDNQLTVYNKELDLMVKQDSQCQEILKIEGIGPITASAIIATIGDAKLFKMEEKYLLGWV